jgi:hypothetical protein
VESHEVGAGEEMLKALSALKQSGEMKQVWGRIQHSEQKSFNWVLWMEYCVEKSLSLDFQMRFFVSFAWNWLTVSGHPNS